MAHVEATRVVVEADETFDGKIIPTEQADLGRPVRVRDGATVEGSVYGGAVETYDGAAVEGSVMASDSIEMDGSAVGGEIGTPGKVVAARSRVEGTVTGKRVRLTDCVVRGNVVGMEVILEDCVVLGIAAAERRLVVEDSLCYTFRARGEASLENATLVLPQAIADGEVDFRTPVSVAGLGRLAVPGDDGDGLPRMDENDLYEQDGTGYLTLAPRVLNLEVVTERLEELEQGVMAAVDDTGDEDGPEMDVKDVLALLDVDPAAVD